MAENLNSEILGSEVFRQMRQLIFSQQSRQAFPTADFGILQEDLDWDLALFLASALDSDEGDGTAVQAAVMDVAFGALESSATTEDQKTSAALLLERHGNWPSISLAVQRGMISAEYRSLVPVPLRIDSVHAVFEHQIIPLKGTTFLASRFQTDFWAAAQDNKWVSVSAPTAAGKSYVVKRWIIDEVFKNEQTTVCYIVPTRARRRSFSLADVRLGPIWSGCAHTSMGPIYRVHTTTYPGNDSGTPSGHA